MFYSTNWQGADTDPCFFKDNNAAFLQDIRHIRQVGSKERYLSFGASLRRASKKNHGRLGFLAKRQEGAKVSVCRDDDPIFTGGSRKNRLIFRLLHSILAHMGRIVPNPSQAINHKGR